MQEGHLDLRYYEEVAFRGKNSGFDLDLISPINWIWICVEGGFAHHRLGYGFIERMWVTFYSNSAYIQIIFLTCQE